MDRPGVGRPTKVTSDAVPATALDRAARLSLAVTALMGIGSVVGLVRPEVYPVDARDAFVPNDAVNLALGVPALLLAAWQGPRGSLLATLAWPGALGYVVYTYTAYLAGLPFGWLSILSLALVLSSVWGIAAVLRHVDAPGLRDRLGRAVPIRLGGWVAVAFGCVFAIRAAAILTAVPGGAQPPASEVGVLVADLVVSAAWVVGGATMVRRRPAGYAVGLGILVLANLLFAGLLMVLLLGPALTGADLAVEDVVVVAAMWPVTLVPGVLFGRGVAASEAARMPIRGEGRNAGRRR